MAQEAAEQAQEQPTTADQVDEQTQEEPQGDSVDWKAMSRKWEARAKKNEQAEKELAELKAAQMTEQEKANARAEKAEAELSELKAQAERAEAAREVAAKSGVALELVEAAMNATDKESLEAFVKLLEKQEKPVHSAPRAIGSKVTKSDGAMSNGDVFAQAAQSFFK